MGDSDVRRASRCVAYRLLDLSTPSAQVYSLLSGSHPTPGDLAMSKGTDRKKEVKKKPLKTKEEKRAEKRAKQAARGR